MFQEKYGEFKHQGLEGLFNGEDAGYNLNWPILDTIDDYNTLLSSNSIINILLKFNKRESLTVATM